VAKKRIKKQAAKTPSDSTVQSRYIIMPDHANQYGTAFGGVIISWIDMVAAMAAQKHCGREAVTAGIDSLIFKEPINIGDHVVLKASVNYVGHASMEVGVRVDKEDPFTGKTALATTAHLTFVALDKNKKPTAAGPLIPKTSEEKRRYKNAQLRVKARKQLLKRIKTSSND
jgi:acyl-CoA hydrolase